MGTLFRDLRRQFVSFTWMLGVFYIKSGEIKRNPDIDKSADWVGRGCMTDMTLFVT